MLVEICDSSLFRIFISIKVVDQKNGLPKLPPN